MDRADLADGLTLFRIAVIPVMVVLIGAGRIDAAAVMLGVAWLSDFLDGRIARTASRRTRLSGWDLRADAWLAAGEGIGVAIGGYFSWWVVAPLAGVVVIGTMTLSNPLVAMVGTGALSALFIWTVLFEATHWWLPIAYGAILLVADWHRFWAVIMPAVWRSVVSIAKGERHGERRMVVDEWVE